ncbi:peptidyl-prolyl cis-trans isomerase FKBP16-1, chloroplastic isoform X2 [Cornus florida]|uniref:peptidyl-prolyl cis-trans isomerase FKBP16-1, chloroplastic isoform X2 n=1 Tax=Cornus florida TaxID=4283 RepID=UPI002896E880|nr:peptidyl-prolyl cis-trans isomerase FKBP16-1, chloroplastic isoform X2 [Cornus florida]
MSGYHLRCGPERVTYTISSSPVLIPCYNNLQLLKTLRLGTQWKLLLLNSLSNFQARSDLQDIVEGEGPEAREGDLVEVNYVCRRSNGYFVHSTVDQFSGESSPIVLPLDEKQIIKGLKDVLIGMKVGGKRRALIPPSVGYINENLSPIPDEFGPRRSLLSHAKEPLIFEVQLLKVL